MIETQTFILFSTSLHLLVAAVIVSFALVISSCCSSVKDITEITCNNRPKGPHLVGAGSVSQWPRELEVYQRDIVAPGRAIHAGQVKG